MCQRLRDANFKYTLAITRRKNGDQKCLTKRRHQAEQLKRRGGREGKCHRVTTTFTQHKASPNNGTRTNYEHNTDFPHSVLIQRQFYSAPVSGHTTPHTHSAAPHRQHMSPPQHGNSRILARRKGCTGLANDASVSAGDER